MPEDDLRLNSLSRYSKQSSQYVLEVYSHCEVPAGCGGAVLRWRNPRLAVPLEIWAYTAGDVQFFLDGVVLTSGRPLVRYGEHVFSWVISGFDPSSIVLACSASYTDTLSVHVQVTPPTGQSVSILSAPDGTWRYTFDPPPGTWAQLDFDDSEWQTMIAQPVSEEEQRNNYRLMRAYTLGAQPLGVVGIGHTVWIRRRFSLSDDALAWQETNNEK